MPATVSYTAATRTATLTPQSALTYGAGYTVTVKGGLGGVTDTPGNALAASVSWSFSVEASPPQLLVVTSTARPFGSYVGEILKNEGLSLYTAIDVAFLSPALLSGFDVVVLGDAVLNPAQVSTLTRLGRRRRQPDRDAPRQAARRPARAHDHDRHALERLPQGRHDAPVPALGSPARRCSTTARPTTTR